MIQRVMKTIVMMIDADDDYSPFQIILFRVVVVFNLPKKTDDVSRRHHWFSLKIKSEERGQKLHSDDVHYADLDSTSDWLCRVGIWPPPRPVFGTLT